jgi:hypothetical protein
MTEKEAKTIAGAISSAFISPNVGDSNWEPANIVDVVDGLSDAIINAAHLLGTNHAASPMGAIEAHSAAILEASEKIARVKTWQLKAYHRHNAHCAPCVIGA